MKNLLKQLKIEVIQLAKGKKQYCTTFIIRGNRHSKIIKQAKRKY